MKSGATKRQREPQGLLETNEIVCLSVYLVKQEHALRLPMCYQSTVASSTICCKPRPRPRYRTFISHHDLVCLTLRVLLNLDIALDLRQGDESYELRIAAHHSLVVQSLTKELRRLTEVIRA